MGKTRLTVAPSAIESEWRMIPNVIWTLLLLLTGIGLWYLGRYSDYGLMRLCAWVALAGAIALAGVYVLVLLVSLVLGHRVRMTKDHLILPEWFLSGAEVCIAFRDLRVKDVARYDDGDDFAVRDDWNPRAIIVSSIANPADTYTLRAWRFPSRSAWDDLHSEIDRHISAARREESS